MITKKQLIFTLRIGYNIYSCNLVKDGKDEFYEIMGNKTLKRIKKENQSSEELDNLFIDISFEDFKKEVLKRANKF